MALLAVKFHLFVTIIATQMAALGSGKVPYFPIEVSRTAASSDRAAFIFQFGMSVLLGTLNLTQTLTKGTFTLWIGLLVIAFVRDTDSWWGHMAGVGIVFCGALIHLASEKQVPLLPLAWAIGIMGLRVVVRSLVLIAYDPHLGSVSLGTLKDRTHAIMFRGRWAFADQYSSVWDNTIEPTLQICGVLQWVAFYCLSLMF